MRVCNGARERIRVPRGLAGRAWFSARKESPVRSASCREFRRRRERSRRETRREERTHVTHPVHLRSAQQRLRSLRLRRADRRGGRGQDKTAGLIERVSARSVESAAPVEVAPSAAWAPASSAQIRIVEALVVASVCGYFGFGLLSTIFGR